MRSQLSNTSFGRGLWYELIPDKLYVPWLQSVLHNQTDLFLPVEPTRGQIIIINTQQPLITHTGGFILWHNPHFSLLLYWITQHTVLSPPCSISPSSAVRYLLPDKHRYWLQSGFSTAVSLCANDLIFIDGGGCCSPALYFTSALGENHKDQLRMTMLLFPWHQRGNF